MEDRTAQEPTREIGIDIQVPDPPLRDVATIIGLIAAATSGAGMKATRSLDEAFREDIKVTQEAADAPDIRRDVFRGEQTCTLLAWPEANDDAINS